MAFPSASSGSSSLTPTSPTGTSSPGSRSGAAAADALPVQVHVRGLDGPPPQDDTWVEVVGDWVPPRELDARASRPRAVLDVTTQAVVPPPVNPYE